MSIIFVAAFRQKNNSKMKAFLQLGSKTNLVQVIGLYVLRFNERMLPKLETLFNGQHVRIWSKLILSTLILSTLMIDT